MKTSVIIICKSTGIVAEVEYKQYFDEIYIINSINDVYELFNKLESDYIIIASENEYYAEDSFMLVNYIKSHEFDFVVGNRTYNNQYLHINKLYKWVNKKLSTKISKITGNYIPDLLSTNYVLSKTFYKNLSLNSNFQMSCIKNSKKFAYIDVRYNSQKYSVLYSIKNYISTILYRKDN